MEGFFPHLRIQRLSHVNPRRRRPAPRIAPPDDPRAHAAKLSRQIEKLVAEGPKKSFGFDPRLLMKLEVSESVRPDDFEAIPGLTIVSQEGRTLLVLFASEEGVAEFQRRLKLLAEGGKPRRQQLLFAVKELGHISPEDRMGRALKQEGVPKSPYFTVDVELWPLERMPDRGNMINYFERWCRDRGIEVIDSVKREQIIMYRLNVSRGILDELLHHRDVRLVDLPPRYKVGVRASTYQLQDLPPVSSPRREAAGVVVLDTGVATGHPLLGPAVGDAQTFVNESTENDQSGHGTMVAGIALYGDLVSRLEERNFVPELYLYSGKVTEERFDTGRGTEYSFREGFVENAIARAVDYFVREYGCRVFNVSLGDIRKPYNGGHVRGLAAVLDELARKYGVLFVVPTGNFEGTSDFPRDWWQEYPDYLFSAAARIIDPAPALNALTVGSLARYDAPRLTVQYNDPAYQPIARRDEPSPFSRSGPGPGGAIKPEVVEYGGNYFVDLRTAPPNNVWSRDLGELSTNANFMQSLFGVDSGTSYAAPKVAHLAGLILNQYPEASADLLRALIVAQCKHPLKTRQLLDNDEERILRLVGYGKPDWNAVLYSTESRVTLFSEDEIGEDEHHFYEIPLPEDFIAGSRRMRRITVALAHTPLVRRTRIDYKASSMSFRVIRRSDVEIVLNVFRASQVRQQLQLIPEVGDFRPSVKRRSKGTVQAATWQIVAPRWRDWDGRRLFVVVTRSVPEWARGLVEKERYALVIVLEDSAEVRHYTAIQQMLRARIRL